MLSAKRVLIADDHTLFRRGLSLVLHSLFEGIEVLEAQDADEALAVLEQQTDIDMVLLDLAMPGMEGFAGLRLIRQRWPDLPVVMLSAVTNSDDIMATIRAGARGYILKSSSDDALKHALALVLSGETYLPSQIFLDGGMLSAQPADAAAQIASENPLSRLTDRQRDVLVLLMEGQSNKEIARELGLLESTIKAHVKMILNKLNAANRTQAAMIAAALGLPATALPRSGAR